MSKTHPIFPDFSCQIRIVNKCKDIELTLISDIHFGNQQYSTQSKTITIPNSSIFDINKFVTSFIYDCGNIFHNTYNSDK